jgi:hypothetical protein
MCPTVTKEDERNAPLTEPGREINTCPDRSHQPKPFGARFYQYNFSAKRINALVAPQVFQ